MCQG
jgi:AcrR family transcriptional regulator